MYRSATTTTLFNSATALKTHTASISFLNHLPSTNVIALNLNFNFRKKCNHFSASSSSSSLNCFPSSQNPFVSFNTANYGIQNGPRRIRSLSSSAIGVAAAGAAASAGEREKDYYSTLNVSRNATLREIKSSYRKLARQYHPDMNKNAGAEDKFKEISVAYETVEDKDGAGVCPNCIEYLMKYASISRSEAVRVLKAHNGNLVRAASELDETKPNTAAATEDSCSQSQTLKSTMEDEAGVSSKDVESLMKYASIPRSEAVRVLKANNGNLLRATLVTLPGYRGWT